ncbi:hypothetical protein EON65_39875, partial [archaeon]
MIALRGGAKTKKHTPSRKTSSVSKGSKGRKPIKNDADDEDSDEDDDGYEEDRISFMGKSRSKAKGGKKKMQLTPWGSGSGGG